MHSVVDNKYSYQFDWLGVPINQIPEDLIIFQEIVYNSQPDLILETGVARGGSIIFLGLDSELMCCRWKSSWSRQRYSPAS